jgi:hypothetical protein
MCRIPYLVSILLIAILPTLSAAHQPDPAQIGANVLLRGSHGHFITRTADLFIDDNTNFDQPVSITQTPFVLRAWSPYDMHLDPGWDQNGWDIEARRQKLTAPGATRLLVDSGPDLLTQSAAGDPVLHIDLAAFYDDNESDELGGFWANWRIIVTPVQFGPSGPVQADARFLSLLRGPFWSGEKLEVADTKDGYRPQIMHYTHLGIWNWHWPIPGFGPVDAVEVKLEEGNGLLPNNDIVTYVVQRDETSDAPITLSDTGDVVALSITADGRFQRVVTDATGLAPNGRPRIMDNPDGHDVDVRFATRPLQTPQQQRNQFEVRHVVGPHRFRGHERTGQVGWEPDANWGRTELLYIDNVSYTPGWDCVAFPFDDPFDVEDDFEFSLTPSPQGVEVSTGRGGCEDRTTLFFRTSQVGLPDDVIVTHQSGGGVRVSNGSTVPFTIPKTAGYDGFAFTELLAYATNGDDDVGFQITKTETATHFNFTAQVFNGHSGSAITVRATAVEWPAHRAVATDVLRWDTAAAESGAAHLIFDMPIPMPEHPYIVIHEILTYQPSGDDDMSWSLYFERIDDHVNVQLASGNAGNDSGVFVEAEARVLQFPAPSP